MARLQSGCRSLDANQSRLNHDSLYSLRIRRSNKIDLELAGKAIRWLGGLLAYTTLGVLLFGIWRGTQKRAGRTVGRSAPWLRTPLFYLITSFLFFGSSFAGWIPLPVTISQSVRLWILLVGSLLYFPGLFIVLWGRLALGRNYFVSTGLGAQVFSDQQLVTSGPYAVVRHPMYAGLILAALGSVLVYLTWTTLTYACFAPLMILRARREEAVLAAEFGQQWQDYCQQVPAFIPGLKR